MEKLVNVYPSEQKKFKKRVGQTLSISNLDQNPDTGINLGITQLGKYKGPYAIVVTYASDKKKPYGFVVSDQEAFDYIKQFKKWELFDETKFEKLKDYGEIPPKEILWMGKGLEKVRDNVKDSRHQIFSERLEMIVNSYKKLIDTVDLPVFSEKEIEILSSIVYTRDSLETMETQIENLDIGSIQTKTKLIKQLSTSSLLYKLAILEKYADL